MKNKCIYVIGPESSGSILIAKIIAHFLNIAPFSKWNGHGLKQNKHKIYHRSLPYSKPPEYPNIEKWVKENKNYEQYFVLTTRDITLSEISKIDRFNKDIEQVKKESLKASNIIKDVLKKHKSFIWSYETFMFLQEDYLKLLLNFLNVEIDNIILPIELKDGNKKRIFKNNI